MLDVIVKAIFYVIGKIGDLVMLPIVSFISLVIPDFSLILTNFLNFINNYIFNRFNWVLSFLMVPKICINAFVTIFSVTITIMIGIRAYLLIVRLYNKFKP